MPIRVACPDCRAAFNVREEYAGKRGKCPRCQATVEVPAPRAGSAAESEDGIYVLADAPPKARAAPVRPATVGAASPLVAQAVAPTRRSQTSAQILAAFRGEIEPVRPTVLYRLWILIVTGMMVLLPLLYVALIGLVASAVAWHAVHNITLFQNLGNGNNHGRLKGAVLLYAGPLVAGAMVLLFMIKPLFARPGKRPQTRQLDPAIEPLVFAFVDGVCESVGSPRPCRIEVDCDVNASARRAAGALSVLNNDLVLTIGLPLAAGLSLKQFAGVLAHEFGHFSQGAGMRLSTLIRTINFWFARVVYERDAWDEKLAGWSSGGDTYAILIVLVARAAVWITRRVLWLLMLAGHAASGFLMRQMEFDADRYEARMVGGTVFAATSRRLRVLGLAAQGAYSDLATSWQEHRLPDDLPKLILANVAQIPEPVHQALRDAEVQGRTGLFDTHPADKERIARAEAEAADGLFRLDGPATDLFRNFDSLARAVTFDHYRNLIGPNLTKDQLYPVADALHGQAALQQGNEAYERFFLNTFGMFQSLPLPAEYPAAPADLEAAKAALDQARTEMELLRDDCAASLRLWDEIHNRGVKAEMAVALLRAGNKIKAADFDLEDRTLEAAEAAAQQAEADFQRMYASLQAYSVSAARRLRLALGLLEADAVVAKVPDGPAHRDEARALYPCAAHLGGRLVRELIPVVWGQHAVVELAQKIVQSKTPNHPGMNNGLVRAGAVLHDRLEELHWKIGDSIPYPFEHAQEDTTLGKFALPSVLPPKEAIGDLATVSGEAVDKLGTVYRRVLGRLAVTAEEVEKALGLPPLAVADSTEPNAALV